MGGYNIRGHIVSRMLDGGKGMDFFPQRQHNNPAGMLPRGAPDAHAPLHNPVNLAAALAHPPLLIIIPDIAKCRLICQRSDSSGPVRLPITENHFAVGMGLALVFPGEIQVDIRLLIPLKAQESFKRNVKPFFHQGFPAFRAVFVRHVAPGAPGVCIGFDFLRLKIAVMAFPAVIMWRQRVNFGDPRHRSHKGRTYRPAGAYQIPILIGFPHQLLGNNIHHRIPVGNNGIQLPFQPFMDNGGQFLPIDFMGFVVADIPQHLVGIFNYRRAFVRADRGNFLAHVGNPVGVGNDNFLRLPAAKVVKFRQHFLGGAQKQGGLVVRILKSLPRHNNPAVHLILRVQEMHVAGGYYHLLEFFPQLHNFPVNIL